MCLHELSAIKQLPSQFLSSNMSSNNAAAYLDALRAQSLTVRVAPDPPSSSPKQITIKAHFITVNPLDYIIQQTGMIVPESAYPSSSATTSHEKSSQSAVT